MLLSIFNIHRHVHFRHFVAVKQAMVIVKVERFRLDVCYKEGKKSKLPLFPSSSLESSNYIVSLENQVPE
jgi:hypothetical protein